MLYYTNGKASTLNLSPGNALYVELQAAMIAIEVAASKQCIHLWLKIDSLFVL